MNMSSRSQQAILDRFSAEKPIYEKFGEFVLEKVIDAIRELKENPELFFEIPPRFRVKEEGALIEKALYREKGYKNPYEDITDKVGVRFVVLFTDRMKIVDDIIEKIPGLKCSKDRDFLKEQKESPLVFSYQSDHYVVHPEEEIEFNGVHIPKNFYCEIQVRSLTQHAYAQITHDIFYKPAIINDDPEMRRQVARCMAIMEITDEKFNEFIKYNEKMEEEMSSMLKYLQGQYSAKLGLQARVDLRFDKTMLWDLDKDNKIPIDSIHAFYNSVEGEKTIKILASCLRKTGLEIYKHVSALFVAYLLMKGPKEKNILIKNWGFDRQLLEDVSSDFGESIDGFQQC
jgi:ppGpp synthetase/RelA/SpoT-type nucleotidyltranferase